MKKDRKLIIIGDSVFAQLAYEFFTYDSRYEVVAFAVERAYLKRDSLGALPVIAFEDLESFYPPEDYSFFAAIVFTSLNRLRTRLYLEAKARGYTPASYVGSNAQVHPTTSVGEHCFVCEATVVHPSAMVGSNVVLWSGTFVGDHAVIGNNCFTLPHALISGFAQIGDNCIVGPNASVGENVVVGNDCWIEAGQLVTEDMIANG